MSQDLPRELMVMGRIPPAIVVDYLHKITQAPVITRVSYFDWIVILCFVIYVGITAVTTCTLIADGLWLLYQQTSLSHLPTFVFVVNPDSAEIPRKITFADNWSRVLVSVCFSCHAASCVKVVKGTESADWVKITHWPVLCWFCSHPVNQWLSVENSDGLIRIAVWFKSRLHTICGFSLTVSNLI